MKMNASNSSEITKTEPTTTEKFNCFRSSSSCKRPYKPRRQLNIRPMPFDKELEEITNEPLPAFQFSEDESEDSNKEDVLTIDKEQSNETEKENNFDVESESVQNKNHDSFDLDFGMLSLETPIKPPRIPPINENEIIMQSSARKENHNLNIPKTELVKKPHQFVTPKYNKFQINSRLQYSVNAKSYDPNSLAQKEFQPRSVQKLKTSSIDLNLRPKQNQISRYKNEREEKQSKPILENKIQASIPAKNIFEVDRIFQRMTVNDVEYITLNLLGRGGSSQVYHGYDIKSKGNRAIKCVSLGNPESATGYINEVELLHKLQNCDRIIKMYDYEIRESEKILLVVLEMGGADLAKILRELATNTSHVPLYMLLFYWMEMLYAVKQIHSNGIVHSDLKPANFLKADGALKLIDFGIASCIQSDMTSVLKTVPEGSFNYISPEAIVNESNTNNIHSSKPTYKISYKSDVWSLGCILYQLVYRKTPFQHITNMWKKLSVVGDPNHVIEYPDVSWAPPRVMNTIKRCLKFEMKSRPSVDDLIAEYEEIFNNL